MSSSGQSEPSDRRRGSPPTAATRDCVGPPSAPSPRVASLCQHEPLAADLAAELAIILDLTVRASSASECVNSVLALYLHGQKSFAGRVSAQNFLNLFIRWLGPKRFDRGKPAGQSPFEIACVRILDPGGEPTDDWLAALGYPGAA